MELVGSILIIMGRVMLKTFTTPLYVLLYLLLFMLVVWQYRRLQNVSESLYISHRKNYIKAALVSTLIGLLGGAFGSVLLVLLGIDLSSIGINQLWLVAIALMFIQPRFLCFSYAAGVLAVSNLLIGYPHVSIPQLMGLVAVLHMVESLLILINGPHNAWPIYIKKQGKLRGGFNLQQFWPIPLVALMSVAYSDLSVTGLEMPHWWPLLKDYASYADDQAFMLFPVLAVLGYGEISTSRTPFQASRKSSLMLFVFSLMLLLLAILASNYAIFLPLAALFSPLGHELVIWLGMRAETRPPIYMPPDQGVMILDVLSGSASARAGLKSRDIILKVNDVNIHDNQSFQLMTYNGPTKLQLEIERKGKLQKRVLSLSREQNPGITLVPDASVSSYLAEGNDRIFFLARRIWLKIKAWLSRR